MRRSVPHLRCRSIDGWTERAVGAWSQASATEAADLGETAERLAALVDAGADELVREPTEPGVERLVRRTDGAEGGASRQLLVRRCLVGDAVLRMRGLELARRGLGSRVELHVANPRRNRIPKRVLQCPHRSSSFCRWPCEAKHDWAKTSAQGGVRSPLRWADQGWRASAARPPRTNMVANAALQLAKVPSSRRHGKDRSMDVLRGVAAHSSKHDLVSVEGPREHVARRPAEQVQDRGGHLGVSSRGELRSGSRHADFLPRRARALAWRAAPTLPPSLPLPPSRSPTPRRRCRCRRRRRRRRRRCR